MEQSLALVAVEHVAYHFDILYGYLVPEALGDAVLPGVRVQVSFGGGKNAKRQGIVFALDKPQPDKTYKAVSSVLDRTPLFTAEMLDLARF